MTKDFSNNLGGFIRLLLLLFSYNCLSQVLPSTIGVHHKKESETQINYALAFDGNKDYINTGGTTISSKWTAEVWFKKTGQNSVQNFTNKKLSGNQSTNNWALRLGQWKNRNKIGITKYASNPGYCCDYYINNSTANTSVGKWEHVAWTYSGNTVKIYVNGEMIGSYFKEYGNNSYATGTMSNAKLMTKYIGYNGTGTIKGEIDEVRFWNDTRTTDEINDNMFIQLNGDETGLVAYYKMSNGTGNTLTDNSSSPKYNGTLKNMTNDDWVTSYAPIGNIDDDYKNSIEAIWAKTDKSKYSSSSNGLFFKLNDDLTEQNFTVFGSNSSSDTNTNNLPSGTTIKSSREWQIDEHGDVQVNIFIDISAATGNTVTPADASNYKLIYKSCASCNFSIEESGDNISNSDWVKFENVSLRDGYYAIASTDTEL
tara:strand:- start:606 stop:1883 length:1278 start_codon:yes stop_codon:yes gene_type:complete